jgi:hypothetical protein
MVIGCSFEGIQKKAVVAYLNAEPIVCLEDVSITSKTVGHCAHKL